MVRKSVFKYRCIFIWCCLCCVSIVKAQVRDLESPYYIYPRQAEQHIDLSQNLGVEFGRNPMLKT